MMATFWEIVGAVAVLAVTGVYGWCSYLVDQDKHIREARAIANEIHRECVMHFFETYTVD